MQAALVEALDLVPRPPRGRRAAGRAPRGRASARAPSSPSCAPTSSATTCARSTPPPAPAPAIPHVRDHVPERTLTTWLLARRVRLDGVRHRRPAEVRRRRGRRARARPPRRAPRRAASALLTCGAPGRPAAAAARRPRARWSRCAARWPRRASRPTVARRRRAGRRRCAASARLARGRGLVVVVSDFRDGRAAAGTRALRARLAARATTCSPSRSSTRARPSCPTPGHLVLVDPETGKRVEADSVQPRAAAALRARPSSSAATRSSPDLRRARARHVEVATDADWLRALGRSLR